jgi:hypothetical protein
MRDQVFEVQVLREVQLRLRLRLLLRLLLLLRLRLRPQPRPWPLSSVPLGGDTAAGIATPVGL